MADDKDNSTSISRVMLGDPIIGTWRSVGRRIKWIFYGDGTFDLTASLNCYAVYAYTGGKYENISKGHYCIRPEARGVSREKAKPVEREERRYILENDRLYDERIPDIIFYKESGQAEPPYKYSDFLWTTLSGIFPLVNNGILWRQLLINYAIVGFIGYVFFAIIFAVVNIMYYDSISIPFIMIMPVAPVTFAILPIILLFILYHLFSMVWASRGKKGVNAWLMINDEGIGCELEGYKLFGRDYAEPFDTLADISWSKEVQFFIQNIGLDNVDHAMKSTYRRILWPRVKRVKIYEKKMAIEVKGELFRLPVIFYCTEDNYVEAVRAIGEHVEPFKIKLVSRR
jgi:hypothetical protein